MGRFVRRVWVAVMSMRDEEAGITAVEYAILAGVIGGAVALGAITLGSSIQGTFERVAGLFG